MLQRLFRVAFWIHSLWGRYFGGGLWEGCVSLLPPKTCLSRKVWGNANKPPSRSAGHFRNRKTVGNLSRLRGMDWSMTAMLSSTSDRSVSSSATDFSAGHGLRRLGKPISSSVSALARIASFCTSGRLSSRRMLHCSLSWPTRSLPNPTQFDLAC